MQVLQGYSIGIKDADGNMGKTVNIAAGLDADGNIVYYSAKEDSEGNTRYELIDMDKLTNDWAKQYDSNIQSIGSCDQSAYNTDICAFYGDGTKPKVLNSSEEGYNTTIYNWKGEKGASPIMEKTQSDSIVDQAWAKLKTVGYTVQNLASDVVDRVTGTFKGD